MSETPEDGVRTRALKTAFDWTLAPQLSPTQTVFAFIVPSAIGYLGFHFVLPTLVGRGLPAIVAWPIVASVMLAVFSAVPIVLMKREAAALEIGLGTRMAFRPVSIRSWLGACVVLALAIAVSVQMQAVSVSITTLPFMSVPHYFPFFLDPRVDPMTVDAATLTPGFNPQGAYWLIGLFGITLFLNLCFEEFYFRSWLLPKMQSFGQFSWALNGFGFASYHTFQLWLFPQILPLSLCIAYVMFKTKSIWPAFAMHFLANLASLPLIFSLVFAK